MKTPPKKNNSVFRDRKRIASGLTIYEVNPAILKDAHGRDSLGKYTVIRKEFKVEGRVVKGKIQWIPSEGRKGRGSRFDAS
jgi:hypothetical protein